MDIRNKWNLAKQLASQKRGQAMGGTAGVIIGVMITVIIIVAVALPVSQDVVNNLTDVPVNGSATVDGTTATIIDLIPLFLGLAALVVVASLFS